MLLSIFPLIVCQFSLVALNYPEDIQDPPAPLGATQEAHKTNLRSWNSNYWFNEVIFPYLTSVSLSNTDKLVIS